MADLRIVDAPEIPTENITGEEKLPTGGSGNYSISLDSLADYTKTKKDLADNTTVDGKVNGVRQELDAHVEDLLNPHQVTKGQIGLGNVDNTADADKPVSNSTQAVIISAVTPKADKSYVDNALSSKSDKTHVDTQLALKSNKADVYTKAETYTKQESSDLVNNSISTALTPINTSLDLAKRGVINRYDSSLTYNSGERVVLTNGDIVKSTVTNNTTDPNVDMTGWVFPSHNKLSDRDVAGSHPASSISYVSISQETYNNGVENITDMLAISNPVNGMRIRVQDELRGGSFEYVASRASENNGGTVFNGWVRKYYGSVYLDWFCETDPKTTDCSLYMERALAVTKGVKCSGREFLFTGRVGISEAGQSNYALRMVKINGDGDTVFNIDCSSHNRATFTSRLGKADPTSEANNFVAKVTFSGINFIGVNATKGHDLTPANKNTIDKVFDGDRIYNMYINDCNFSHLYSALQCQQGRGSSVEGGNAYSQSVTFDRNHFYHLTYIVEADQLLNFRFTKNMCEKNYAGFRIQSKSLSAALGVCSFSDNLFEAGGMFMDIHGDVIGGSIWNNYFEYNIFEKVLVELCQILIVGENKGCVIGANNFGGQIDFTGYDTEYVDIKTTGKPYNDSAKTDVTTSKPVILANSTTSRKLISDSRGISIGNSMPYTLKNGWQKVSDGASYFNSMMLHPHQENDVSYSRGIFNKPINYSANAVDGHSVTTLRASDASVIVAIMDLSKIEGTLAKNKISTITNELDCNIEWVRDGLTIGNVSAKIHISVIQTGFGSDPANQYNNVRVGARLMSIIQPFDIPIVSNASSNLMKKQFLEPDVGAVVEPLGGGRYAIRLTNYLGVGVGAFGAPSEIYNSFTCKSSVGCRQIQEQVGANVSFIGYWW